MKLEEFQVAKTKLEDDLKKANEAIAKAENLDRELNTQKEILR